MTEDSNEIEDSSDSSQNVGNLEIPQFKLFNFGPTGLSRSEPDPAHDVTPRMTSDHGVDPEEEEIEFVEPMVFDLVSEMAVRHETAILYDCSFVFKVCN